MNLFGMRCQHCFGEGILGFCGAAYECPVCKGTGESDSNQAYEKPSSYSILETHKWNDEK